MSVIQNTVINQHTIPTPGVVGPWFSMNGSSADYDGVSWDTYLCQAQDDQDNFYFLGFSESYDPEAEWPDDYIYHWTVTKVDAQGELVWSKQIISYNYRAGPYWDECYYALALGQDGYLYANFTPYDFDPYYPYTYDLNLETQTTIYKIDPTTGTIISTLAPSWSGDYRYPVIWGLDADVSGNVYVYGFLQYGGIPPYNYPNYAAPYAYLLKLDPLGSVIWSKMMTSDDEYYSVYGGWGWYDGAPRLNGLARDAGGNIYVTGSIYRPYDPGQDLTDPAPYVVKLDSSGNMIWKKAFTSSESWSSGIYITDIAVAPSGNIYICGNDEDGISSWFGEPMPVIIALDSNGNFRWIRIPYNYYMPQYASYVSTPGIDGQGRLNAMVVDDDENIYIAGEAQIQPDREVGNQYAFMGLAMCYDVNGDLQWTRAIEPAIVNDDSNLYWAYWCQATDISLSGDHIYISGRIGGDYADYMNGFLAKMSKDGSDQDIGTYIAPEYLPLDDKEITPFRYIPLTYLNYPMSGSTYDPDFFTFISGGSVVGTQGSTATVSWSTATTIWPQLPNHWISEVSANQALGYNETYFSGLEVDYYGQCWCLGYQRLNGGLMLNLTPYGQPPYYFSSYFSSNQVDVGIGQNYGATLTRKSYRWCVGGRNDNYNGLLIGSLFSYYPYPSTPAQFKQIPTAYLDPDRADVQYNWRYYAQQIYTAFSCVSPNYGLITGYSLAQTYDWPTSSYVWTYTQKFSKQLTNGANSVRLWAMRLWMDPDNSLGWYLFLVGQNTNGTGSFLAKINTNDGSIVWSRTTPDQNNNGVAVAPSGNVYVSGNQITPGRGSVLTKYDSDGNWIWSRSLQHENPSVNTAQVLWYVALDSQENVYWSGYGFDYTDSPYYFVDWTPVAKYSSSGDFQWANVLKPNEANGYLDGYGIDVSPDDDPVVISSGYPNPNDDSNIGLIAKLPRDGTGLGTYGNIIYAAAPLVSSTYSITVNTGNVIAANLAPGLANASVTITGDTPTVYTQNLP